MTRFAVIDLDREGADAVLMLLPDRAKAEAVAIDLRDHDVRADVVEVDPALPSSRPTRFPEGRGG
jgi:hypothetical protein